MMLKYIYDGSFEGLLTAVYTAYYSRQHPESIIRNDNLQQNIMDEYIFIDTDSSKAQKVYHSIMSKISPSALYHCYHAFLSENEDIATWIYEYLRLGWKVGKSVDMRLSDNRVHRIHTMSRKVKCEQHRMLGLLRFSQLENGIYYAPMEPDNNIAALLAPHFVNRLSDQQWIIHDVKRHIAVIYDLQEWFMVSDPLIDPSISKDFKEIDYQKLWKQYFKSIAISGRINPKLQKQFMPVRYWKHLTEMQ